MHVFLFANHPLADRAAPVMAGPRDAGGSVPDPGAAGVGRGHPARRYERLGVPPRLTAPAVGARGQEDRLRAKGRAVALGEAGTGLARVPGLRRIPLVEPAPLLLWSLGRRREDRGPGPGAPLCGLPAPKAPAAGEAGVGLPEAGRADLGS